MSIATPPAETRVLLSNVSWSTFMDLVSSGRPGARFAYDRGDLEIMTVSWRHERIKKRMARMIEAAAVRMDATLVASGSTTLKIEMKKRGLEPDESYYIAHAAAVRNVEEMDLSVVPPPDLAVEIDITSSSLDQLAIYADMGVPEVWIYDDETIHVWLLQADGHYREQSRSVSFAFLPMDKFLEFLRQQPGIEEPEGWRAYEEWLRGLKM